MYWHRLLHSLLALWPAALVWATLVLPTIAMESRNLRLAIEDMPWWMRWGLWTVEHTWPYSRMVGMSLFGANITYAPTAPKFGPYCWCERRLPHEFGQPGPLHDPGMEHCPMCRLPLDMGSSQQEFFLWHVLQTHVPPEEDLAWVQGEFLWLDRQPMHVWLDRQTATR